MDPNSARGWITGILLGVGVVFMILGAIGVARMPDVYLRAQSASKTATLGLSATFLAVAVHFGDLAIVSRALTVIVLAWVTVPVGAHAISRAAHATGVPLWPPNALDELRDRGGVGADSTDGEGRDRPEA